jgi:hypothetical protein
MEGSAYALLYFVASGWAYYFAAVWLVAIICAAVRAHDRTARASVWWTHLGAASLLSGIYPLLLVAYLNADAMASRFRLHREEVVRLEWTRSLPALAPGHVAEAVDATFSGYPSHDMHASNEIFQRISRSLASPNAAWTNSDLKAFDEMARRTFDGRNPFAGAIAWHREKKDLATAADVCANEDRYNANTCRLLLRESVCGWCAGNPKRCVELAPLATLGPEADALSMECIARR